MTTLLDLSPLLVTYILVVLLLMMIMNVLNNYYMHFMIMVNYADLWLLHSQVTSLLDSARLELKELKAHSLLLGACTSCPLLRSDLEASAIEIKELKHKHDHSSRYTVLTPPCELFGSLKGKLFHATKENTEPKQEITYLTACLEKTVCVRKWLRMI
jgi:hypothetical protein